MSVAPGTEGIKKVWRGEQLISGLFTCQSGCNAYRIHICGGDVCVSVLLSLWEPGWLVYLRSEDIFAWGGYFGWSSAEDSVECWPLLRLNHKHKPIQQSGIFKPFCSSASLPQTDFFLWLVSHSFIWISLYLVLEKKKERGKNVVREGEPWNCEGRYCKGKLVFLAIKIWFLYIQGSITIWLNRCHI